MFFPPLLKPWSLRLCWRQPMLFLIYFPNHDYDCFIQFPIFIWAQWQLLRQSQFQLIPLLPTPSLTAFCLQHRRYSIHKNAHFVLVSVTDLTILTLLWQIFGCTSKTGKTEQTHLRFLTPLRLVWPALCSYLLEFRFWLALCKFSSMTTAFAVIFWNSHSLVSRNNYLNLYCVSCW